MDRRDNTSTRIANGAAGKRKAKKVPDTLILPFNSPNSNDCQKKSNKHKVSFENALLNAFEDDEYDEY